VDKFTVGDNDERRVDPENAVKIDRRLSVNTKQSLVWTMSVDEAKALRDTLDTYLDDKPEFEMLDDAIRSQISGFTEGRQVVTGWIVTTIAQDPFDQKNDMYRFMSADGQSSALSIGLAQMSLDYLRNQLEVSHDEDSDD
jgi:hypothetical protein